MRKEREETAREALGMVETRGLTALVEVAEMCIRDRPGRLGKPGEPLCPPQCIRHAEGEVPVSYTHLFSHWCRRCPASAPSAESSREVRSRRAASRARNRAPEIDVYKRQPGMRRGSGFPGAGAAVPGICAARPRCGRAAPGC